MILLQASAQPLVQLNIPTEMLNPVMDKQPTTASKVHRKKVLDILPDKK